MTAGDSLDGAVTVVVVVAFFLLVGCFAGLWQSTVDRMNDRRWQREQQLLDQNLKRRPQDQPEIH